MRKYLKNSRKRKLIHSDEADQDFLEAGRRGDKGTGKRLWGEVFMILTNDFTNRWLCVKT
jgi:hypothetical protein